MSPPLKPPPSDLHEINLETVQVQVANLFRISKYDSGEPYFGRSAGNRFDASLVRHRRGSAPAILASVCRSPSQRPCYMT